MSMRVPSIDKVKLSIGSGILTLAAMLIAVVYMLLKSWQADPGPPLVIFDLEVVPHLPGLEGDPPDDPDQFFWRIESQRLRGPSECLSERVFLHYRQYGEQLVTIVSGLETTSQYEAGERRWSGWFEGQLPFLAEGEGAMWVRVDYICGGIAIPVVSREHSVSLL